MGGLQGEAGDGLMLFWAKEILGALLILGLFWVFSQLAIIVLSKWGRKLTSFTSTNLDDKILERAVPYASRILLILGVYFSIQSLPLHDRLAKISSGLIYIVLVVIVIKLVYHALNDLMEWYVSSHLENSGAAMSQQMLPVAEKLVSLLLMATGLIIVLKHFNYDILSLVTALGIGSLAIGMAAKDTLAHMISGFTLMLDRPFQIGDRIKLANGQVGDVVDIGLRSTKIQGLDSTVTIIPNSDLCNSALINMVRPSTLTQGSIRIGVGYGSDMEKVKSVLLDIARSNSEVTAEPQPQALFSSFGECALNMLFLFWVSEPARLLPVTDQINCEILRRFREESIEIPFPTRTVIMEKEQQLCPTE